MGIEIDSITIRARPHPGDLGALVEMHGRLYAREYGLDLSFEPYVARPLSDFMIDYVDRGERAGRLWVAETAGGRVVGSIALLPVTVPVNPHGHIDGFRGEERPVTASTDQLRWFLIEPDARGGLGRRLMSSALESAQSRKLRHVVLWTFDELHAAIRLYECFGFRTVETKTAHVWGRERRELKMQLDL